MMMPLLSTDGRQAWLKGLILRIILGGVCLLAVWNTLNRQTVTSVLTEEQRRAIRRGYCPDLRQHPDIFGCFPSPTRILLITDIPALLPAEVGDIWVQTKLPPPHLPAPPGVIVVQAAGPDHRPELSECPPGYREARKYRWRCCLSWSGPHVIVGNAWGVMEEIMSSARRPKPGCTRSGLTSRNNNSSV